jgi:hypothetical protein
MQMPTFSPTAEFFEVFVNRTFHAAILKLHFRREGRIPLQNVAREILHPCPWRPEAQRNVERLLNTRLDVVARSYQRITGFGWKIRRRRHIHITVHIITAKIERTGSVIQLDNRHYEPRIGNGRNRKRTFL